MAFLNEQTSRQRWTVIRSLQYAHYLHVDDGIFIGTADSESRTNEMMQKAADSLENIGFIVKDRTACADMRKTLGYEVCTRRGRVMFPSESGLLAGGDALDGGTDVCLHQDPTPPPWPLDLGGSAPPGASVVAALRLSVHRGARRRAREVVEESPTRGSVDGRKCVLDVC